MEIRVYDRDIEKALKVLRRKVQKDGLMGELKKRTFYEKPSVKLKTKRREAQKKIAVAQKRRARARLKKTVDTCKNL